MVPLSSEVLRDGFENGTPDARLAPSASFAAPFPSKHDTSLPAPKHGLRLTGQAEFPDPVVELCPRQSQPAGRG